MSESVGMGTIPFEQDEESTYLWWCHLRLPYRNTTGVHTIAKVQRKFVSVLSRYFIQEVSKVLRANAIHSSRLQFDIPKSSDDSTNDHVGKCGGSCLERSSNQHDQSTNQYRLATAKFVSDKDDESATHETSDFINGNHQSLDSTGFVARLHHWELL